MASTYTTNLKLEKVATGEKAGLWGTVTNTNLEILEQASSGYLAVDVASADVTLTLNDGATSNGKNLFFKLTGTLAGNRNFIMPTSAERIFIVKDSTTRSSSNYTLTVKKDTPLILRLIPLLLVIRFCVILRQPMHLL